MVFLVSFLKNFLGAPPPTPNPLSRTPFRTPWRTRLVNQLEGKALGLQNLARGEKFSRDEEDIKAGLTMLEVVCKPVLNYEGEVWAFSSKTDEQRLERIPQRFTYPL